MNIRTRLLILQDRINKWHPKTPEDLEFKAIITKDIFIFLLDIMEEEENNTQKQK